MEQTIVRNFIGGRWVDCSSGRLLNLVSPVDGCGLGKVVLSDAASLDDAVKAAKTAFPEWSNTPIKERVQVFFRFRELLLRHRDELVAMITRENGKTTGESEAEVDKCIELTEFATSLPQLVAGEILEVSKGVECRAERVPAGIAASIVPFNFPAMVPCWSMPNALVLGNCMIMKPSEKVPQTLSRIAELLQQAGLPDGVLNIVNGDAEIVNAICDHPDIDAVSFVGSSRVARHVYRRATSHDKRCIALGGAKNHIVVLPDAHPAMTAQNVTASMSGCAGQRCMAASVMVGVGTVNHIIDKICDESRRVIPGETLGAVISEESKKRIETYITEAEQAGARVLVDGRNTVVRGKEKGFYVGPTVIDFVKPDMRIAREEVFGPVISIIRTDNLDQALEIENANPYGNAASVFTGDGASAGYFMRKASAGMIGVNVGVPVPREPFGFGGWNESKFGVCDITGKSSIEFWTRWKKTTVKWNREAGINWMS